MEVPPDEIPQHLPQAEVVGTYEDWLKAYSRKMRKNPNY